MSFFFKEVVELNKNRLFKRHYRFKETARFKKKYFFCEMFQTAFRSLLKTHWIKSRHALREQKGPIPRNLSPLTSTPSGP